MNDITLSEALTRSAAAMVAEGDDVIGALVELLRNGVTALGGTAGGILVQRVQGPVELLAATSHRAADLEVAQMQADEGPCLDAIRDGALVRESGREALPDRWPRTGPRIVAGGYGTVHAAPMTWRGQSFGDALIEIATIENTTLGQAARAVLDRASRGSLAWAAWRGVLSRVPGCHDRSPETVSPPLPEQGSAAGSHRRCSIDLPGGSPATATSSAAAPRSSV